MRIEILDRKGAFQIKRAMPITASKPAVSRRMIYNYPSDVRVKTADRRHNTVRHPTAGGAAWGKMYGQPPFASFATLQRLGSYSLMIFPCQARIRMYGQETTMPENRSALYPAEAPTPAGPYSPGLLDGDLVFVSGQVGRDPTTGQLAGDTIESQARQTFINIGTILKAGGCDFHNVLKVGIYLSQAEHFAGLNQVYREFFSEPFPARTTVICGMPDKAALVEVDVIARAAR
jgi:2-iminobutanoate/2-iminopropanoate deaminase